MKRMIALMLILALALTLVACGGSKEATPDQQLIGTWENADGEQMDFAADGTGNSRGPNGHLMTCTWKYLPDSGEFEIRSTAFNKRTTITDTDGTLTLTWLDVEYTKVAE